MKKNLIGFRKRNLMIIAGVLLVMLMSVMVVHQTTAQEDDDPLEWVTEISLQPSKGNTPLMVNAEVVWTPESPWKILWEFGDEVEMGYTEVVDNIMLYKVRYVTTYLQDCSDPTDYKYWTGVKIKYLNPGRYTIRANITVYDDTEVYTKTISNTLTVLGSPVETEDTDANAGASLILFFILRLLYW